MNSRFDTDKIYVLAGTASWELDRNIAIDDIYLVDQNQCFFKDVMYYTAKAIREDLSSSLNFFKKQFGLDFFGQVQSAENQLCLPGLHLSAFTFNRDLPLELLVMDSGKTIADVKDGGWMVQVCEPGFIGIYNDCPVYYKPGTIFLFGFIKVFYPDNTCKTFHYRSLEPLRISRTKTNAFDHIPLNFAICDLDTRNWGYAIGMMTLIQRQCLYELQHRLVLNFPEPNCQLVSKKLCQPACPPKCPPKCPTKCPPKCNLNQC